MGGRREVGGGLTAEMRRRREEGGGATHDDDGAWRWRRAIESLRRSDSFDYVESAGHTKRG